MFKYSYHSLFLNRVSPYANRRGITRAHVRSVIRVCSEATVEAGYSVYTMSSKRPSAGAADARVPATAHAMADVHRRIQTPAPKHDDGRVRTLASGRLGRESSYPRPPYGTSHWIWPWKFTSNGRHKCFDFFPNFGLRAPGSGRLTPFPRWTVRPCGTQDTTAGLAALDPHPRAAASRHVTRWSARSNR